MTEPDVALPGMPTVPEPPADDTPPDPKRSRPSRARKSRSRAKPAAPADKSPRKSPPRPPRSRVTAAQRAEVYGQKMLPLYAIAAMGSRFVPGVGEDGAAIILEYAPLMAKSWGPLAAENEAARALIDKLTESSAVLGVVTAHLSVAAAVLAAKGKAPAQLGMLAPLLSAMGDPSQMAAMFGADPGGSPAQEGPPARTPPPGDDRAAGAPDFARAGAVDK